MKTIEKEQDAYEYDEQNHAVFRDPTREEVEAAFESMEAWVYDPTSRDLTLDDEWEHFCMRFLLKFYLEKTAT